MARPRPCPVQVGSWFRTSQHGPRDQACLCFEPPLVDRSSGQFSNEDLNIWHIPPQRCRLFCIISPSFLYHLQQVFTEVFLGLHSHLLSPPFNNLSFLQHLLEK